MKISKNFILSIIFVIISLFIGFLVPNIVLINSMTEKPVSFIQFISISCSFIAYVLSLIFILPKIKYVRFLLYPMSVFSVYLWTNSFLYQLKNPIIYMIMSFALFPMALAAYIWGLIKDVENVKRDQKDGNIFATILFFVVSAIAILYVVCIVSPFGSKYIFINHLESFVPIYMWMTIPAYVLYVCFCKWVFDKLRKVRWLAYSIMMFNLYCGLMYCLVASVGDWHVIFFFVIFAIIVLLPMMAGACILGGVQDVQERQKLEAENKEISL